MTHEEARLAGLEVWAAWTNQDFPTFPCLTNLLKEIVDGEDPDDYDTTIVCVNVSRETKEVNG